MARTIPPTATKAHTLRGATLSSSQRVRGRPTRGSVSNAFANSRKRHERVTHLSAIDPGIQNSTEEEALIRRVARVAAAALYLSAFVIALVLLRPAFRDAPAPTLQPRATPTPLTDTIRQGESVATFAARHGLDLGELLALNPKVDSLSLKAGTELRIG
jgi:LysM repeat protein